MLCIKNSSTDSDLPPLCTCKTSRFKTNKTKATTNFLRLLKTGNYFCEIVVCDVGTRYRGTEETTLSRMSCSFTHNTRLVSAPLSDVKAVDTFRINKDAILPMLFCYHCQVNFAQP